MDRLASCYFCGVAVEAPLEEYPVVPRDLRPSVEDQSTVVLCPECRRKLSTIVERVVTATTDPAQTELGTASGTETDADSTIDGQQEGAATSPAAAVRRFDDDERPNLVDFEASHEREPGTFDRETGRNDADDADEAVDGSEGDELDEADASADGSEDDRDSETDVGTSEDDRTDQSQQGDHHDRSESPVDDDGGTGTTSETGADDPEESDENADRDFSTSAYNSVVRLLQNREFPVAEDEITTVAGSAYGIGDREAGAVIDALIERGILRRDGGQLYRADD